MAHTYRPCANAPDCTGKINTNERIRYCRKCIALGFRAPRANQSTAAPMPATIPSVPEVEATPSDTTVEKGDDREQTVYAREEVRSLEDLIRVCKIDVAVWDIVEWHANKWEMGYKDAFSKAHTTPLFQIKARMKRKSSIILTMEALRRALIADIHQADPFFGKDYRYNPGPYVKGDYLFEFAPFDLHMGKLTWDEETVTNYDIDIATDLFNASLDFLLARAQRVTDNGISRILCVFGNDVAHIDNKRGETTAGTRLDVDTRYIKVYRRIVAVHRRAVDLLSKVAPVDIVVVPGNHDELTSYHLGEILAAIYENNPRVSVDNSPRLHKYYEFGTNLFGFTHGDSERVSELPLAMAREMSQAWARCDSREWHIGHKHISEKWESRGGQVQDLFSDKGVRVRRLTSLSAHDAWHTKHSYMDRRACEGFVFHRTAGFTDHLSFNVDHFTGKALTV